MKHLDSNTLILGITFALFATESLLHYQIGVWQDDGPIQFPKIVMPPAGDLFAKPHTTILNIDLCMKFWFTYPCMWKSMMIKATYHDFQTYLYLLTYLYIQVCIYIIFIYREIRTCKFCIYKLCIYKFVSTNLNIYKFGTYKFVYTNFHGIHQFICILYILYIL